MNERIIFRVDGQALRNAAKQILVNRGARKASDFTDFLVSECLATLRAVGTSTEIPVRAEAVGAGRVPMDALERIAGAAKTFKTQELIVTIADGSIKVNSFRYNSDAITVGTIPDLRVDLPVNASTVDVLAVAELLTAEELVSQGLHRRVQEARDVASEAITNAEEALKRLRINRRQLQEMVDAHIKKMSQKLQRSIGKGQS